MSILVVPMRILPGYCSCALISSSSSSAILSNPSGSATSTCPVPLTANALTFFEAITVPMPVREAALTWLAKSPAYLTPLSAAGPHTTVWTRLSPSSPLMKQSASKTVLPLIAEASLNSTRSSSTYT